MARATKRNITRQSEAVELQPEQWLCIARLLEGATDEAAAEAAGVSRATVQRWKLEDDFRAALNGERRALWAAHTDKLRGLLGKSLDVLGKALDSDDERLRVQAALKVLASAGDLWAAVADIGSSSVAGIEAERLHAAMFNL